MVNNVTGGGFKPVQSLQEAYKKVTKHYVFTSSYVLGMNDVYTFASKLTRFPKVFGTASASGNMFLALDAPLAAGRLVKNLTDVVVEKSPLEKVKAGLGSVKETALIGLEALGLLDALQFFRVVSTKVLPIAPRIAGYLVPLLFVTLPFTLYDIYSLNALRMKFQASFKKPENISDMDKRIVNVLRGCGFVSAHAEELEESLSLSKKIRLKERVATLVERFEKKDEKAVEEAELFLSTLRTRIRVITALEVVEATSAIGTLVTAVASLVIFPAAPALVPASLLSAAVTGLTVLALKTIMLNKNPFEKPTTWYRKMQVTVQEAIVEAGDLAYKIAKCLTIEPVREVQRQFARYSA